MTRPDDRFAWSKEDNLVAEAELEISTVLTDAMKANPAVSLDLLISHNVPVGLKIMPILMRLKQRTGKFLSCKATEHREGPERRAFVRIEVTPDAKSGKMS